MKTSTNLIYLLCVSKEEASVTDDGSNGLVFTTIVPVRTFCSTGTKNSISLVCKKLMLQTSFLIWFCPKLQKIGVWLKKCVPVERSTGTRQGARLDFFSDFCGLYTTLFQSGTKKVEQQQKAGII